MWSAACLTKSASARPRDDIRGFFGGVLDYAEIDLSTNPHPADDRRAGDRPRPRPSTSAACPKPLRRSRRRLMQSVRPTRDAAVRSRPRQVPRQCRWCWRCWPGAPPWSAARVRRSGGGSRHRRFYPHALSCTEAGARGFRRQLHRAVGGQRLDERTGRRRIGPGARARLLEAGFRIETMAWMRSKRRAARCAAASARSFDLRHAFTTNLNVAVSCSGETSGRFTGFAQNCVIDPRCCCHVPAVAPTLKLLAIAIMAVLPALSAQAQQQQDRGRGQQRDDSRGDQDSRSSLSDAVRRVERDTPRRSAVRGARCSDKPRHAPGQGGRRPGDRVRASSCRIRSAATTTMARGAAVAPRQRQPPRSPAACATTTEVILQPESTATLQHPIS